MEKQQGLYFGGSVRWAIQALSLILLSSQIQAQTLIPIGVWRSHFNYKQTQLVAEAADRIYGATTNALFYLDRSDNSLNRITRTDGLSDVAVSALAYAAATDWLVIGYANGNIDLYRDDEIVNLSQILEAQIIGSRRINHISISQDVAYVATDFGIVVLNLVVPEIKESYLNLGPTGEENAIRQTLVAGDSLFAASDFGLIAGNIANGDNLLDFQNWRRLDSSQPVAAIALDFINMTGGTLIAGDEERLYGRENNNWSAIPHQDLGMISWLSSRAEDALVIIGDELYALNPDNGQLEPIIYVESGEPRAAIADRGGNLWVADGISGLYGQSGAAFANFSINGPETDVSTRLHYHNNQVFALHGSLMDDGGPKLSLFTEGDWSVFAPAEGMFENHLEIASSPGNGTNIVSYGDGLLAWESMEVTDATTPGSPFGGSGDSTLLTGIGFDSGDNLWVAEYNSSRPYHRRNASGAWDAFSFPFAASAYPVAMTINELDDVWAQLDINEGGGVLVFNADTDQERLLTNREGEGDLPSLLVTDVVFDRTGQAWIGTDDGIAFIPNPVNIFDDSGFDAIRPIFDNGFLLENEYITCLAVDGGNNKWIGTRNGAWLFNENAEEALANLTMENSPLPSNDILDIEVDPITGEVYLSTASGLVSFRGRATAATEKHQQVKIFPNPVRPGFTGEIGISGLARDAVVKITDIRGGLIIETTAEGGTATWNGRGFGGNAAESGIYLVFSASPDGEDTFVGKIAIVR